MKEENIKTITPFRELLFNIRDEINVQEFVELKNHAKDKLPEKKWKNLPNGTILQERNNLFTALEEVKELSPNNLTFLRSFLEKTERKGLVKLVDEFIIREKTKVKRQVHHPLPKYSELFDDVIDGLRKDEFIELKESCKSKLKEDDWNNLNFSGNSFDTAAEKKCLFVALEKSKSLGPTKLTKFLIDNLVELGRKDLAWKFKNLEHAPKRFSVLDWRVIIPMVFLGVVVGITFYQFVYSGPTSDRMWLCSDGAIHPLHMVAFDFTSDNELQHVCGVEFNWTTLKEKLDLDFEKHPDDVRYYLNVDRCGRFRNMLFGTPQIREGEVFAVSRNCTAIYFHSDGTWKQHDSAKNVMCIQEGKRWWPLHLKWSDTIKILDDEHVKHKDLSKNKEVDKDNLKAQSVQTVYTDPAAERNNLSVLFLMDKLNELVRTTGSLSVRPLRVIMFDFTTMDIQRPRVRGVEFEWSVLKAKLHLCFEKHTNPDMHYYLNMDRYGAGGVRHVRNAFLNLPQVRGPEVFAVNSECTAVYYHDNKWKKYRSATNITRSHNAFREETSNSILLAQLLDDKTEYYQE